MDIPKLDQKPRKPRRTKLEKIANDSFVGALEHHNAKDGGEPLAPREIHQELLRTGIPLTLKQRLEIAVDDWESRANRAFYQVDLAKACHTTPTAVWMWFEGKTLSLRGKNLFAAAKFLSVLPQWLDTGLPPMRAANQTQETAEANQYVRVPRLSLSVAAGHGSLADLDSVTILGTLAFRRDWLDRKELKADCLQIFEAAGNSMSPYINDKDVVLVDTANEAPGNDEVWVILGEESLGVRVKRILIRERKDWVLRSDNPDKILYPDEIIPSHLVGDIRTIGKVVWRGG